MSNPRIPIHADRIADFCRKWKITELALFGSVLREDFGPESDVDVLVAFHPSAQITLYDLVDMEEELSAIFGRKVDLVEKRGLVNPFIRHEVVTRRQVLYAA